MEKTIGINKLELKDHATSSEIINYANLLNQQCNNAIEGINYLDDKIDKMGDKLSESINGSAKSINQSINDLKLERGKTSEQYIKSIIVACISAAVGFFFSAFTK